MDDVRGQDNHGTGLLGTSERTIGRPGTSRSRREPISGSGGWRRGQEEQRLGPVGRGQQIGLGQVDEPVHRVGGTVPAPYLPEAFGDRDDLPSGADRQVAEQELVVGEVGTSGELLPQIPGHPPQPGLDVGARVVGHQGHDGLGVAEPAKVSGPVDRMEAGGLGLRAVADIVYERCSLEHLGMDGFEGAPEKLCSLTDSRDV